MADRERDIHRAVKVLFAALILMCFFILCFFKCEVNMFLYLGGDITVKADEVVGIFDIEECSVSRVTAEYLNLCQKKGIVEYISEDMPKSFIVADKKTYISNVAHSTITRRARKV